LETPPYEFNTPIVGSSPSVGELRRLIGQIGRSPASVLVTGESGVGKELVARNLHRRSPRRSRPFVALKCAALNPGVLESELFGHGKGAFTGAIRSHAGLFEQAEGGTIFLDEIGEIPVHVQAKLLRVLQDREIRRMGSAGVRTVDVRVISATNADLERMIRDRAFRVDLFYRLNVVEICVPPLRQRGDDIFELVAHFFTKRGATPPRILDESAALLMEYRWPGNVRELENELERMLAIHGSVTVISPKMFSARVLYGDSQAALDVGALYDTSLPRAIRILEENLLKKSLARTNWNMSKSARILGLSRQGLANKIKRYGLTRKGPGKTPEADGKPTDER